MLKEIWTQIRTSVVATILIAALVCGLYPAVVWLLGRGAFPAKANGSLVSRDGQIVGSSLLARGFSGPEYFHPRPSAAGEGYDTLHSGGSNLGPTARALVETVRRRVDEYRKENNLSLDVRVPADAVTASASGLDPHVSVANAKLQAGRVALARKWRPERVLQLLDAHTEGRDLGIFGEPRVNVLLLNLALDGRR